MLDAKHVQIGTAANKMTDIPKIGPLTDIDDFNTNGLQCAWNILAVIYSSIENTTIAFLQLLTCVILIPLGILVRISRPFLEIYDGKHSKVNINTPNLFTSYQLENTPLLQKLNTQFIKKHNSDPENQADIDTTIFFLLLSALVYESNEIHDSILEQWGFKPNLCRRVLYPTSCSATVIGHPIESNGKHTLVLFIVFKGTSPMNINEWLSDCDLVKITSVPALHNIYNITLPDGAGLHKGFYHAFIDQVKHCKRNAPINAFTAILKACMEVINTYEKQNKHFDANKDLKVFMTGHSLGAGLCSVFTILLACFNNETHKECNDEKSDRYQSNHCDDEKCAHKQCHGTKQIEDLSVISNGLTCVYTYGTPHVCNKKLSIYVNNQMKNKIQFRAFRNGNDIVGIVPIGSDITTEVIRFVGSVGKGLGIDVGNIDNVSKISDYYNIGAEYRIGYYGNIIPQFKEYDGFCGDIKNNILYSRYTILNSLGSYVTCSKKILKYIYWMSGKSEKEQTQNMFEEMLQLECPTLSEVICSIAMPTFLGDHIPSEYAKHMYKYKKIQKSDTMKN